MHYRNVVKIILFISISFMLSAGACSDDRGGIWDDVLKTTLWVQVSTPAGTQSGVVTIEYALYETLGQNVSITAEYSVDGGSSWSTAASAGGDSGTSGLSGSKSGTAYTFAWNSVADNAAVAAIEADARFRITPQALRTGRSGSTGDFVLNNAAPADVPFVDVQTPGGILAGNVSVYFTLFDCQSDVCTAAVEFSGDEGASWADATLAAGSDDINNLASSPGGTAHTVIWDSVTDAVALTALNNHVRVRITPSDGNAGIADVTDSFIVNNSPGNASNNLPGITITQPPSGTVSHYVAIGCTFFDCDSDVLSVIGEYSVDGGSTWSVASISGGIGLASSPTGIEHIVTWKSYDDGVALAGVESDVRVRLTPYDSQEGYGAATGAFGVDNTTPQPTPISFFTVELTTDDVVFCIDMSGSMASRFNRPVYDLDNNLLSDVTKMSAVTWELKHALVDMDESISFNIVLWSSTAILTWNNGGNLPANASNVAAAMTWLDDNANPGGVTPLAEAAVAALSLAPKTMYLLTDGAANFPTSDPAYHLSEINTANTCDAVIHTFYVGTPTSTSRELMQDIASDNDGIYVQVETE